MITQKLLVIDDDPMVSQLLSAVAKDIGYEVETASSGAEGIKLIKNAGSFDVVIADIMMPEMGGIEFLKAVNGCLPRPVVIMITAYGSVENAKEAMLSGAFDFLTKPLDIDLLEKTLDNAMHQKRLLNEFREGPMEMPRILAIETDTYSMELIKEVVTSMGYDIATALNGKEGLDLLKKNNFEIIIADAKLPDTDGITLLSNIKEIAPHMGVIFVTAHPEINSVVQFIKKGAYDIVSKPFGPDCLKDSVRKAMERKRRDDQAKTSNRKLQLINYGLKSIENLETKFEFVDEIINFIPNTIILLFGPCIVKLWVRNYSGDDEEIRLLTQKGSGLTGRIKLKEGEGITGSVYHSGEALYNIDSNDFRFIDTLWLIENNVTSCNVIPLKAAQDTIGVLSIFFTDTERMLEDYEKEILQSFCDIAAITLKNSMLFNWAKEETITDQLTGIKNRRYANMRLEEEIRRARREDNYYFSVIMSDVNHFKMINDTQGHAVGDMVLQHIAHAMSDAIRATDIAARYGGDEFLILLSGTDCSGAEGLVKKVIEKIADINQQAYPQLADIPFEITATYGISCNRCTGNNISDILTMADKCLYEAKSNRDMHYVMSERFVKDKPEQKNNISITTGISNQETLDKIVTSLAGIADYKDKQSRSHSRLVSDLSVKIGEHLSLSEKAINKLRLGGMLHALGKLGISTVILNKEDKLTKEEMNIVKKYPRIGAWIISNIYKLSNIYEIKELLPIIRGIHERWDGKGYPDSLKGDEIPIESRIIAVADAYFAMKIDRAYRKRLSEDTTIDNIISNSGTQFDPKVVDIFLKIRKGSPIIIS